MITLTSHILDTSKGKPATGVIVILYVGGNDAWQEHSRTKTNSDGRLEGSFTATKALQPGIHKLRFETKDYFDREAIATFYPYVEIIFDITKEEHYHVPLLMNPFGYSTYRGT